MKNKFQFKNCMLFFSENKSKEERNIRKREKEGTKKNKKRKTRKKERK